MEQCFLVFDFLFHFLDLESFLLLPFFEDHIYVFGLLVVGHLLEEVFGWSMVVDFESMDLVSIGKFIVNMKNILDKST